ncbi:MAG: hypothetical protein ACRDO8_05215 [Nocardioidaceae bacterium]
MTVATPLAREPRRLRGALVTVAGYVALGIVVAWLWSVLAHPAVYTVTRDGAAMGEAEAGKQFGVTVTFAWLGALAGVGWGAFCAWRYAWHGWPHVVVTVLGAAAASAVAWRLGMALGPPDPEPVARAAEAGSHVPMRLRIDSYGVLLAWPVAGLAGLLAVVTWLLPDEDAVEDDVPEEDVPHGPGGAQDSPAS